LYIEGDTIFLSYGIVMPLWFFSSWLASCVLCCKKAGAQLFYDGAKERGIFIILHFLAENEWRSGFCSTGT